MNKPSTPSPIRQLSPAHADAHARFLDVLAGHLADGARVPCLHTGGDWLTDNRAAQAEAAAACGPCPALAVCREYGRRWETAGIYGGISAGPRAQGRAGARPAS